MQKGHEIIELLTNSYTNRFLPALKDVNGDLRVAYSVAVGELVGELSSLLEKKDIFNQAINDMSGMNPSLFANHILGEYIQSFITHKEATKKDNPDENNWIASLVFTVAHHVCEALGKKEWADELERKGRNQHKAKRKDYGGGPGYSGN